jgi:hypothetical protein
MGFVPNSCLFKLQLNKDSSESLLAVLTKLVRNDGKSDILTYSAFAILSIF